MPKPLTDLERRVLDYIIEYLRTNTYQPSIREIGREFAIKSTKTVSELLHSLAVKGWIERDPSRSRGVRLFGMEMRSETVSVPVYEVPQAGTPMAHYALDRKLAGAGGCYLMPLRGDHLLEEGLRQGDLLLVEAVNVSGSTAAAPAEPGDILVVTVGGTNEVRRCARSGESLVVEPVRAGEAAVSLATLSAAGAVQGRVAGVIRRLRSAIRQAPLAAAPVVGV
jgi:repressor LexA